MEAKKRHLLPNPGIRAGFLSLLTFSWGYSVIKKGLRKILYVRDLWQPLPDDQSRELGNRLEDEWNFAKENGHWHGLSRALMRTFTFANISNFSLMILCGVVIRTSFPIMLGGLTLHFVNEKLVSYDKAYVGLTVMFFMAASGIVLSSHTAFTNFHIGVRMKAALGSLIYRKLLRLPMSSMKKDIVKMIQDSFLHDHANLEVMSFYFHYLWMSPLLLISISCVMFFDLGLAALPGLLVIVIMVPIQKILNMCFSNHTERTAEKTKERYLKTKEVIENIEIVKKHAWIKGFIGIISKFRNREMKFLRCRILQHVVHVMLMIFTTRIALLATIISMMFINSKISTFTVIVYFYYFDILTIAVTQIFTRAIDQLWNTTSYLKEVEKFLNLEEAPDSPHASDIPNTPDTHQVKGKMKKNMRKKKERKERTESQGDTNDKQPVVLKNVSSTWDETNSSNVFKLTEITMSFKRNAFVCIVGPSKCGKTSLLHTILQDMWITGGHVSASGPFGYAPQIPWIFSSTVRQNILFGSVMYMAKYEAILRACALIPDLNGFPSGDLTLLREDETILSDRQKLLINFTRAVYREAPVYLFDDNLTGLNPTMGRYIFDKVIGPHGRLNKSLRIFVTNELQYIKEADWVIVMNHNGIVEQEKPANLKLDKLSYLTPIDENLINVQMKNLTQIYGMKDREITGIKNAKKHYDNEMDSEDIEDFEGNGFFDVEYSSGSYNSFFRYIQEGAGIYHIMILFLAILMVYAIIIFSDLWLTFWATLEYARYNQTLECAANLTEATICHQSVLQVSTRYVNHSNSFYYIFNETQEIIREHAKPLLQMPKTTPCILVYVGLLALAFILGIVVNTAFAKIFLTSNKYLHDTFLRKMASARMSFFQRTRNAKIFKIFDIDMKVVDSIIPMSLLESINLFLWITGWAFSTIYVYENFTIPLIIALLLYFIVQYRLLRTTKRLKQLEVGIRTKLSRHFNASLTGISMIRAFKIEKYVQQDFDNLQDVYTSTIATFHVTTTAYSMLLEMLYLAAFGGLGFLVIEKRIVLPGYLITFTVTQLIGFIGMVGWSLKQTASSSSELTSVERIFKYCNVQQELDPPNPERVRKSWPEYGRIVYRDVSLTYQEGMQNAISNVTFNFRAREKVGIIGGSGSGKTSFVNALYRMGLMKGIIEIDRTDINTIAMEDIRSGITTISQKLAIFSGTIKSNLDPFNEYRYDDIIYALKAVQLDELDLSMVVEYNGENLTLKQRQLLSFARAVLRNNRIIVLDEAMANMDKETTKIVKNVITEYLDESTIFTITDQLEHIMDGDSVFVIDNGIVIEKGLPYHLLQNTDGKFYKMVHAYKRLPPAKLIATANSKVQKYPYLKIV